MLLKYVFYLITERPLLKNPKLIISLFGIFIIPIYFTKINTESLYCLFLELKYYQDDNFNTHTHKQLD